MDFTNWDAINDSPDQIKRITSSKKAECTPVEINAEEQIGIFSGAHGVYKTTLEKCDCIDYLRRKMPCKHMYRLAAELGLYDSKGIVSDLSKIKQVEPSKKQRQEAFLKTIEKLESYDITVQNEIRELIYKFNQNEVYICRDIELFEKAIKDGIIEIVYDYGKILSSYSQKHTLEILETNGYKFPLELKKTKKARYEWCVQNASEICSIAYPLEACLLPTGCLKIAKKKVYTYLLRKFTNDRVYDENFEEILIPHGAELVAEVKLSGTDLSVRFPDDDITELLNKNGVNRCLDWSYK